MDPEHRDESASDSEEDDMPEKEEELVQEEEPKPKSAIKKAAPAPPVQRPALPEQPDPKDLDVSKLTPISPEIICRQATINIGTIGHVAHGKSTVVKAISGVQTVRFKNELYDSAVEFVCLEVCADHFYFNYQRTKHHHQIGLCQCKDLPV